MHQLPFLSPLVATGTRGVEMPCQDERQWVTEKSDRPTAPLGWDWGYAGGGGEEEQEEEEEVWVVVWV